MTTSRYVRSSKLNLGTQQGTSFVIQNIRAAIAAGALPVKTITLKGAERLDTLAGSIYGDAKYWWILAAASNIGWGLQVPTGTIINIPELASVIKIVSG